MLKFEDVRDCPDIASLNEFIRQFLAENCFAEGSAVASRTYWALVNAWNDSAHGY